MKTQKIALKEEAEHRRKAKENLETYIFELGSAGVSTARIAALTGKHAETIRPILKRYGLR